MISPEIARLNSAAQAIIRAMIRAGIGDDIGKCMLALGMVAGGFAVASKSPRMTMRRINDAAEGVIARSAQGE